MQSNPNDYLGKKISTVFWSLVILGAVAIAMFVFSNVLRGCQGKVTDPKAAQRTAYIEQNNEIQKAHVSELKLDAANRTETLSANLEWLQKRKATPTKKAVPGMEPAEPTEPAK